MAPAMPCQKPASNFGRSVPMSGCPSTSARLLTKSQSTEAAGSRELLIAHPELIQLHDAGDPCRLNCHPLFYSTSTVAPFESSSWVGSGEVRPSKQDASSSSICVLIFFDSFQRQDPAPTGRSSLGTERHGARVICPSTSSTTDMQRPSWKAVGPGCPI